MTTTFTLSGSNLPPTTIEGSIRLLEALPGSTPGSSDIQTDPAIPRDQPFFVEFRLTITGLFASALRLGKWELSAFFEKVGEGEVALDQTKVSKSFPVRGRDELLATIPLAANTFPPGVYNLVASVKWIEPDDTPSKLLVIKEMGHFQIHEQKAPGASGGSISGTILSPKGEAMPNVEVHLDGAKQEAVLTDAQGGYRFSSLPEGDYTVRPEKDDKGAVVFCPLFSRNGATAQRLPNTGQALHAALPPPGALGRSPGPCLCWCAYARYHAQGYKLRIGCRCGVAPLREANSMPFLGTDHNCARTITF